VVAAFDFHRFFKERSGQAKLLFEAHRKEIMEQALGTFRNVLRNHSFGELLVGDFEAARREHLFCSVQKLTNRELWRQVGNDFYDYIVVDDVHHGASDSYRPIFAHFKPAILLGLTATPERMDGKSVAAGFHNTFAAEIRLPEALEEKLLCPFHYFGKRGQIYYLFYQVENVLLRVVHAKNSTHSCNALSAPHNPERSQQAGRVCINGKKVLIRTIRKYNHKL
jgi:superfamily II DNA or RNA helicase